MVFVGIYLSIDNAESIFYQLMITERFLVFFPKEMFTTLIKFSLKFINPSYIKAGLF